MEVSFVQHTSRDLAFDVEGKVRDIARASVDRTRGVVVFVHTISNMGKERAFVLEQYEMSELTP